MKKAELIALCGERDLKTTGSKKHLIARLEKSDNYLFDPTEDSESVISVKPVKVSKTKKTTALSDEEFVRDAYQTVLKREADTHGLTHYLNLLKGGRDRSFVTSDLKNSAEAKQL